MLSAGIEVIEKKLVRVESVELASVDNAKEHSGQFASPDGMMTIVVVATHNGHPK